VITEDPALAKSKLDPEIATTEVVADAYDHVPAIEPLTVGAVIEALASPYVADTDDHVNVGVALSTVNVAVVVRTAYLPESVGVNVAVTTDDPAVNTVTRLPETVATDVVPDA
jgi:hypothetical protein